MEEKPEQDNLFELVSVEDDFQHLPSKTICKEIIKEKTLTIPKQKPKVEQLSKILIKPSITSHKTICTPEGFKVIIQGKVIEKVFYVADKPEQSVHAAEFSFPFCTFIKLPKKTKIKDIKVKAEDVIIQLIDQKKINKCVLLCICAIPEKNIKHCDC